jgi:hypothetical protein
MNPAFKAIHGHFVDFTAKWYTLCPFGTFGGHLVYLVVIWYVFPVMLYLEKYGNPGLVVS